MVFKLKRLHLKKSIPATAFFIAVLLAGLWIMVPCSETFAGKEEAESGKGDLKELKFAVPGDYTGGTADQAKYFWNGINMAVDEINDNGGVVGYYLNPVKFDCKDLKPDQALSAVNKILADEDILAVITSNMSFTNFEVEHFGKANMPYTCSSNMEEFKTMALKLLEEDPENFQTCWAYICSFEGYEVTLPVVLEKWADEGLITLRNKKAALVTSDIPYSSKIFNGLIKTFESRGWTVTMKEMVPQGEIQDWSVIMGKIRKDPPDIVISTDWWTSNAATFIDQFMENPTNSLVMIQYAPSVPEFVKLTGEKGEAVLTQIISMTLPGERTDRIKEMYMDRYNEEPGLYAYHAYEQVYQYVDAVKKVGNPEDKLAVGKAIGTIERDTVIGHIKYDMKDHMPLAGPEYIPTVVIQVQNGELKILYPDKYAQAELMLPSYYEK